MLHNDTPKFTIPTSRSFSKSLSLSSSSFRSQPEQDRSKRRGRGIFLNSPTLEMADRRKSTTTRLRTAKNRRRIVVSFFFLSLSLSARREGERVFLKRMTQPPPTHPTPPTPGRQGALAISRARGSPCHVHTRAISCTREFFSFSFFERWERYAIGSWAAMGFRIPRVEQSEKSEEFFENLWESSNLLGCVLHFRELFRRADKWSKVGQIYSLRFRAIRICSSFFKSCAPIFASRAERKCFTIMAPNSLLEHILALS